MTQQTSGLPHEDDSDDLVFVLEPEPEGWDPDASKLPTGAFSLPQPVPAQPAHEPPAATQPAAPVAHPWSEGVPAPPAQHAPSAPAPVPHPSQHVPALTPPVLGTDFASHGSIIHRGGTYELTLDGLRLSSEPNIVLALNRFANEAVRRQTRIISTVKDLRTRYHMQFNADGTSEHVAPPVPPEANLGVPFQAQQDLSYQPDGGAAQEEWVADNILAGSDAAPDAPTVDSGFLASLRDRLRRA